MSSQTNFSDVYWELIKEGYEETNTFFENSNSILIVRTEDQRRKLYIYHKSTKKLYKYNGNDLEFPIKLICHGEIPISLHDDKYVLAIQGFNIAKYNNNNNRLNVNQRNEDGTTRRLDKEIEFNNPELERIVYESNENSNPVLMFFKFRFN